MLTEIGGIWDPTRITDHPKAQALMEKQPSLLVGGNQILHHPHCL